MKLTPAMREFLEHLDDRKVYDATAEEGEDPYYYYELDASIVDAFVDDFTQLLREN